MYLDRLVNKRPGVLSESEIDELRQMCSGTHIFECCRCRRKTQNPAEFVWMLVQKTSGQRTARGHFSLGLGEEVFISQFTLCGDCALEKQHGWKNFVAQRMNLEAQTFFDFERAVGEKPRHLVSVRPLKLNRRPDRLDFERKKKRGHRRGELRSSMVYSSHLSSRHEQGPHDYCSSRGGLIIYRRVYSSSQQACNTGIPCLRISGPRTKVRKSPPTRAEPDPRAREHQSLQSKIALF